MNLLEDLVSEGKNSVSYRTKSKSAFIWGIGRGRGLLVSIARRLASVPSSCGMLR